MNKCQKLSNRECASSGLRRALATVVGFKTDDALIATP